MGNGAHAMTELYICRGNMLMIFQNSFVAASGYKCAASNVFFFFTLVLVFLSASTAHSCAVSILYVLSS